MSHVEFLLQSIRAKGYAWREEDIRDRIGEWSQLIGAAADDAAYWIGPDVELSSACAAEFPRRCRSDQAIATGPHEGGVDHRDS